MSRLRRLERRAAAIAAQVNEATAIETAIARFTSNICSMQTHGRHPDGCPPGWRPDPTGICYSPPAMAWHESARRWRPCTVVWDASAAAWVGDAVYSDDLDMWVMKR